MRCDNCGTPVKCPRTDQRFCSDKCRAAGWRKEHLTLRCPHCRNRVHAILLEARKGRSNGS